MKNKLAAAIALASLAPLSTLADVKVYGKANVSIEAVSEGDDSFTEISSNASRLGFKGSEKINDSLEAVYKMEYEVFVDDGVKGEREHFTQRNIYVGLKGDFGTVLLGNMDTPLKTAQNKIDLFGDLRGDIKHVVSENENREANMLSYATPSMSGVSLQLAYMPSETDSDDIDDATSVSLAYSNDSFYVAAAFDSGVEGQDVDATRIVAQYNIGAFQLGALYETMAPPIGDDLDATFVSVKYKVNSDWAVKAQYGQSDQVELGGDTVSVGADYSYSKTCKLFGFYTAEGADDDALDNSYAGLGIELKF